MEADMVPLSRMFAVLFEGHCVVKRRDVALNYLMTFIVGVVFGLVLHWR